MRTVMMMLFFLMSQAGTVPDIAEILQVGSFEAAVLLPAVPQRVAELQRRFQAAMASDPDWWREFRRSAPLGEPLPYHEKSGMSPEEYDEFLTGLKEMDLMLAAIVRLTIARESGRAFRFSSKDLPELDGIVLDLDANTVTSRLGVASKVTEIHRDADFRPGAWDGLQWKLEEGEFDASMDKMTGVIFKFAVGRFRDRPEGIILLRALAFEDGTLLTDAEHFLTYDLTSVGRRD